LDVEELFVKPKFRRKGYGTKLLASLNDLSRSQKLPLRFLIPFSDSDSENLDVVRKIVERIGHRVEISGLRWVPYVGILSSGPDIRPYFPQKPALARPQPISKDQLYKLTREKAGVFDSDFQKAAESVFSEHEELLRRLA
jgi:hypothetical protein